MKPLCLSNFVKTVGVICAFLMPLSASADVTINSTNFPDANFRNYLKGLDIGKDGVLTTNEINNTTTFLLADLGISDLTGIEYFTNLHTLMCTNNNLTSLNISTLTELEALECSFNKLTTLNISSNTKLEQLFCTNNNLRALYIGQNNHGFLKEIHCHNNKMNYSAMRMLMSSLPSHTSAVSANYKICYWSDTDGSNGNYPLSGSYAESMGWTPQSRISGSGTGTFLGKEFDPISLGLFADNDNIFYNYIKTNFDKNKDDKLSGDEIYAITTINVAGKGLTSLKGIEYLTNLHVLKCYNNNISKLDLSKNTFLYQLDCSQNRIFGTDLDNLITNLPPMLERRCYGSYIDNSDWESSTGVLWGQLRCYDTKSSNAMEGNTITKTQKSNCKSSKHWKIFSKKGTYDDWKEYATEEDQLHINAKSFPDSYFRSLITNGNSSFTPQKFDTNTDGYLSATEREAVTTINFNPTGTTAYYLNVESIKGIEYFPNVTQMIFNGWVGLSNDVDLSRNTKTTFVSINTSNILTIQFPKSVEVIIFASQKVGSLNFQNQTKLMALTLTAPNLQSLNINRCYDLVDLFVSGCPNLLQFSMTNNTKLERLNISGCKNIQNKATLIQNIENLTKLTSLKCSNFSFLSSSGQLKLTKATELQELYCDHCQILDLDLSTNTKLRSVFCSYNPMQWLTMPTSCDDLRFLDIQGCWLNNDQILKIVKALPEAGDETRELTLYDSDMSEQNEVTALEYNYASALKNWKCQYISHSGSSTTRKTYDLDNYILPGALPAGAMSYVGTQLPISVKSSQAILGFEFDLILPRYFTLMELNNQFLLESVNENQVPAANIKVEFTGTVPNTDAKIYHIKASVKDYQRGVKFSGSIVLKLWIVSTVGTVNAENWTARVINGKMRPVTSLDDIYTSPFCSFLTLDWLGDVNGDGKVTPADAIMMLYNYFGVEQADFNLKLADVNQDGNYSPADAIQALYMFFGNDLENFSRQKGKVKDTEEETHDPE